VSDADGPLLASPQVVRLSDVEPERVTWLWGGYLPLGKLVTLDGDPGVGKSTVTIDIAARVTAGTSMPDGSAPVKGAVLMLSAEDGLADTIRPRLDAAGADPAQVITITGITTAGEDGDLYSRTVEIPRDLPAVEQVIRQNHVVLVVVDVLMAYLSGDVNSHRDQDVRRALHVLGAVAERCGCCVVVLRHLNKSPGGNALYRGGGSIGIIGAARAGFMCGRDPDDETGTRRVFANVKMNVAAEPPSLAYQLVYDEQNGVARVDWLGSTGHRAADLLSDPDGQEDRTDRDAAADWLTGYLTDLGGEDAAKDIKHAARAAGFSERTLDRARKRAGVTTGRNGFGKGAVYVWRLDPCSPHVRHARQDSEAGKHGEHGGEHGESAWPEDSYGEAAQ
jgi:RecA-family ATPase